ncbi:hypothetical protein PM082_014825 [Marasmius tenuissimus]|nr:hypothetical protein PM082_014825 [Marasmius tenuissimus]
MVGKKVGRRTGRSTQEPQQSFVQHHDQRILRGRDARKVFEEEFFKFSRIQYVKPNSKAT